MIWMALLLSVGIVFTWHSLAAYISYWKNLVGEVSPINFFFLWLGIFGLTVWSYLQFV